MERTAAFLLAINTVGLRFRRFLESVQLVNNGEALIIGFLIESSNYWQSTVKACLSGVRFPAPELWQIKNKDWLRASLFIGCDWELCETRTRLTDIRSFAFWQAADATALCAAASRFWTAKLTLSGVHLCHRCEEAASCSFLVIPHILCCGNIWPEHCPDGGTLGSFAPQLHLMSGCKEREKKKKGLHAKHMVNTWIFRI